MATNFTPVGPTSRISTSLGKVCVICFSVMVTLITGLVMPATVMFDGYGVAGDPVVAPVPVAGITIAVAFEKVDEAVLVVPSWNVYVTVPRLMAPSCSCRVAVMLVPQVPLATKVNGCDTAGPPATTTP